MSPDPGRVARRRPEGMDVDEALLRRYEPVLAFTAGELFFPVRADGYVAASSLWCHPSGDPPQLVVGSGNLTVDRLVDEANEDPRRPLQLRFVGEPLRGREYRRWRARPGRLRLETPGRFTKVGVLARFIDALFRLGLLLRGRIPGGFAAAAEERAGEVFAGQPPAYHGRVVVDGGYVALQYWYFYVMNDWRSTFAGVNDHEADWELVTVYLAVDGDELVPRWIALSSHDERGADLRRRWDDPDLSRNGDHPVVFVGAGSHSGTVLPGDYVVAVAPPVVRPLLSWASRMVRLVAPRRGPSRVRWRIPYVDYHRGDGVWIGAGQSQQWALCPIDDDTPWVRHFRGLWGLDTGDRFGGERAPAGPRFERSGQVRRSWADPVGWVALHDVPASPEEERELLAQRLGELDDLLSEVERQACDTRVELRRRAGVQRMFGRAPVDASGPSGRDVEALFRRRAELAEERRVVALVLERELPAIHPHAHLTHRRVPYVAGRDERDRFLRVWATISSPLLVAAMVAILLTPSAGLLTAMGALLLTFFAIEAVARRRALAYLATVAAALGGLVATGVLAVVIAQHLRLAASVVLGFAALALLAVNLSDLRRR